MIRALVTGFPPEYPQWVARERMIKVLVTGFLPEYPQWVAKEKNDQSLSHRISSRIRTVGG